jgi:predicted DNA-binding antitoxin AbrB/MazE fold protein
MKTKAKKPIGKLDLKEGEEVEIEVKRRRMFGILKDWEIDTQRLKEELREIHG